MDTDYIEPTLRGRITLVVLYLAIFLWYFSYVVYVEPQIKYITTLNGCDLIEWVQLEILYFFWIGLGVLLVTFNRGYQILRLKQFPVPTAYVFKRTKIIFGRKAVSEGLCYLLCGIIVLSGMVIAYYDFDISLIFSEAANKQCLTSG